jgi:hypothetical protein
MPLCSHSAVCFRALEEQGRKGPCLILGLERDSGISRLQVMRSSAYMHARVKCLRTYVHACMRPCVRPCVCVFICLMFGLQLGERVCECLFGCAVPRLTLIRPPFV